MLKERSHNKKVQLVKRFAFPEITLTAMLNTNFECHLHLLSEFWTRTTRRKLRARLSVCVCVYGFNWRTIPFPRSQIRWGVCNLIFD